VGRPMAPPSRDEGPYRQSSKYETIWLVKTFTSRGFTSKRFIGKCKKEH
jgi:hypothetical protein